MSLFNAEDLITMYSKHKLRGELILWCDGKCREDTKACRKQDSDMRLLKSQEREEQLDSTFNSLKAKHNDKYTLPQMRLWSRMICSGMHDDMDNPPDIPAFTANTKKPRKESLAEAISGAATTFVKALNGPNIKDLASEMKSQPVSTGISPSKAIELRMKNLEQLRYLQNLFEDSILNEKEYSEQNNNILSSL